MAEAHGKAKTPEYQTWAGIKKRCLNQNCTGYHRYGGRGISILTLERKPGYHASGKARKGRWAKCDWATEAMILEGLI